MFTAVARLNRDGHDPPVARRADGDLIGILAHQRLAGVDVVSRDAILIQNLPVDILRMRFSIEHILTRQLDVVFQLRYFRSQFIIFKLHEDVARLYAVAHPHQRTRHSARDLRIDARLADRQNRPCAEYRLFRASALRVKRPRTRRSREDKDRQQPQKPSYSFHLVCTPHHQL